MLDLPCPVEGNESCVSFLKDCVAEAEKGEVAHVCVIMTKTATDTWAKFTGQSGLEIAAYYCAALLQRSLMDVNQNRMVPVDTSGGPANRVFYNLAKMPVCFDFVGPLVDAEMIRIREGAPGPLRVGWFWGQDNRITTALNTPQREQNFEGILRPLVKLIGAVEDPSAIDGRELTHCSVAPVAEAARRGETVPKFKAPPALVEELGTLCQAEFGKPPVTITLREVDHTPHRNSNLTEWLKLAEWLEQQGEAVVIIRDTAKARENIAGFTTCYAASENLLVRCALYQCARANLFVANGPAMLAIFGEEPWLAFTELQDNPNYLANSEGGFKRLLGLDPREQFPWARPDQRFIYERDTFEVMRDAWLAHIAPQAIAAE